MMRQETLGSQIALPFHLALACLTFYPLAMHRKGLKAFAILLFLILALSVCYLLLPVVIFVKPPLPDEYLERLSMPSRLSFSYRLVVSDEESLKKDYIAHKPDLVIFSPLSEKSEYIACKSMAWGHGDERGTFDALFLIEEEKLWLSALSESAKVSTAFLHEASDAESERVFNILKDVDGFVYDIKYDDRISGANQDLILNELAENNTVSVLLFDPESSYPILYEDTGIVFYVDFRDGAALYSPDKLISIEPDWRKAIKAALKSDGDISFDYTLAPAKSPFEILDHIFL